MSIRVECPNGSCGKNLKVKDELAGKAVKCRACGTVLKIPAGVVSQGPQPGVPDHECVEAVAAPTAAAGAWEIIERQCRKTHLDIIGRNLFAGGMAALFLLAISPFFNWASHSVGMYSFGIAGIHTAAGVLIILLSLGAVGFGAWVFFQKAEWFPYALYAAGSWGALIFLYLLVQLFRFGSLAGFGLYLGVLMALGVGAAFGFQAFRQFKRQ
jgi:hypothetical protein